MRIHHTHRLERNGDDDKQRRAADCKHRNPGKCLNDDRQNCDKAEERRAERCDAVHNPVEELFRTLAQPDARYKSPALLEVFCNLLRIEGDSGIKIGEYEYEQEIDQNTNSAVAIFSMADFNGGAALCRAVSC